MSARIRRSDERHGPRHHHRAAILWSQVLRGSLHPYFMDGPRRGDRCDCGFHHAEHVHGRFRNGGIERTRRACYDVLRAADPAGLSSRTGIRACERVWGAGSFDAQGTVQPCPLYLQQHSDFSRQHSVIVECERTEFAVPPLNQFRRQSIHRRYVRYFLRGNADVSAGVAI